MHRSPSDTKDEGLRYTSAMVPAVNVKKESLTEISVCLKHHHLVTDAPCEMFLRLKRTHVRHGRLACRERLPLWPVYQRGMGDRRQREIRLQCRVSRARARHAGVVWSPALTARAVLRRRWQLWRWEWYAC